MAGVLVVDAGDQRGEADGDARAASVHHQRRAGGEELDAFNGEQSHRVTSQPRSRGRRRTGSRERRLRLTAAWYSTESPVICMKASSSEPRCGLSSCSTTPAGGGELADLGAVHAGHDQRASSSSSRTAVPVLAQRRAQLRELRAAHPRPWPPSPASTNSSVVHCAISSPSADHDEVLRGQRHLREQVAGHEHGAALVGQPCA